MFRILLAITFVLLLLSSCNRTYLINKSVKSTEINSFAYFEPLSSIKYIAQKNQAVLSDSLSFVAKMVLDSVIQNNAFFKSSDKIILVDELHKSKVNKELTFLYNNLFTAKRIEGVKIPPTLDSTMKAHGQRFALSTAITGFDRRSGNFSGQVAKGIGVGILTLGMYTPVPVKSAITLYGIILDRETGEAIFLNRTLPIEKSPTRKSSVEKQFKILLNPYLAQ